MRRKSEISPLAKSSYWVSCTLCQLLQHVAFVAVVDSPEQGKVYKANFRTLMDYQLRLALALEAYGEALRSGSEARIEAIVRELEIFYGELRHANRRFPYEDGLVTRERDRGFRRRLVRQRKLLERMRADRAS